MRARQVGGFRWVGLRCLLLIVLGYAPASAQRGLDADVVVLSDTSNSMTQNDPKNAVVLVTRLFADIVPGKLAAVRLLDITKDKAKFPHQDTGKKVPCPDKPGELCEVINLGADAIGKAVDQHLLLATRPGRGDSAYKSSLVDLLNPSAADTVYAMSWATIERLFKDNASPEEAPRVVVWLSDGEADDWDDSREYVRRLMAQGVAIRALIFKTGKIAQVKQVGIEPYLVDGSPHELMKAFADAFRYIVQAPFRTDGLLAKEPAFTIKPRMEDVWVVMYGDESLSAAGVTRNGKTIQADYASDHYNGSAYRVVYMKNPDEGSWEAHMTGGGPAASYAVIQRSTITPVAVAPKEVITGVAFPLVVTLRSGENGQDIMPSDLPEPIKIEAQSEGRTIPLTDDGSNGDVKGGDGKYTAMLKASKPGSLVIRVRASNSFLDRRVTVTVDAHGYFRYSGGPLDIDFGSRKAGTTVCEAPNLVAEQQGVVPFELRQRERLPEGVSIELRAGGKITAPGGDPISLAPAAGKKICLVTSRDAKTSRSEARIWVDLAVKGTDGGMVPLRMTWSVRPLTFWERWRTLILFVLLVLLVFFIIYGYIKPYRFPPGLAIYYAPAMNELDDQTPQPVRMWRGVGIGFYRDARACLQENYRINGTVRGAASILQAGPRKAVFVKPASRPVYREVGFQEWELVPVTGRRTGQGEIYRIGDSGPYFRLSMRASS
jgi:hypothetical protein